LTFIEVDDYSLSDIIKNGGAATGKGNSKGERLDYDFEYCIVNECEVRLLNGEPIVTKGIFFPEDFEMFVGYAKRNEHRPNVTTTLQHSDFEALKQNIQKALKLGKENAKK